MNQSPISGHGKTIAFTAAGTPPAAIQAPGTGAVAETYRIHNASTTITAFVAMGTNQAEADANAVIPTGGGASSQRSVPIPPGAIEVLSGPRDAYFTGITASGTAVIYVTPGRGF